MLNFHTKQFFIWEERVNLQQKREARKEKYLPYKKMFRSLTVNEIIYR